MERDLIQGPVTNAYPGTIQVSQATCKGCIFKNNRIKKKGLCWCTLTYAHTFVFKNKKGNYVHPKYCVHKRIKVNIPKLNKELDKLWSLCVRKVGKCQYCGAQAPDVQLQAHHLKSRGFYNTRWDVRNSICLCYRHHIGDLVGIHYNTMPFAMWVRDLYGEDFIRWLVNTPDETTDFMSVEEKLKLKEEMLSFIAGKEKQIDRKGDKHV